MIRTKKQSWILINILGGAAVIGSYILGFLTRPVETGMLWGGVPAQLKPLYTTNMLLAATGYLVFSIFILLTKQDEVTVAGRFGFGSFLVLYLLVLIPSALWMPLTILAIGQSSQVLLWLVRVDLLVVALASLGILVALISMQPRRPAWFHVLAVIGGLAFCFQTVILDAVVWSILFRLK
jgi:hypothetical protein